MRRSAPVCLLVLLAARPALPAQGVLIRDLDRVHTCAGEVLEDVSILVVRGRIVAIGADLPGEFSGRVIDGRGLEATPGLIDAHSHIAIQGGVNEGTDVVTPEVRIEDVLDPDSDQIQRALAGGTTAAHIMHGSANVIGGQNAVVKLKWKRPVDEMVISDAPRSVKFALGENPKRSNMRRRRRDGRRFPATRMGVEAVVRQAFDGALAYRERWQAYSRAREAGRDPVPPRRDLRKEALVDILEGRLRIHCHCYRADEILMMLQLAEEYGIRVAVLHHALEAYRVAPEIARHGAGVSTFADWWGYKFEAYDATPYNAAILHDHGVLTSINSDSADHIRRLNLEAAKSVKYGGLDPEEALHLVTVDPARQLGIDARTGTLEKGKDADIALWTGDPLSSRSRVVFTLVEGEVLFDRSADVAAREGVRRVLSPEEDR